MLFCLRGKHACASEIGHVHPLLQLGNFGLLHAHARPVLLHPLQLVLVRELRRRVVMVAAGLASTVALREVGHVFTTD